MHIICAKTPHAWVYHRLDFRSAIPDPLQWNNIETGKNSSNLAKNNAIPHMLKNHAYLLIK